MSTCNFTQTIASSECIGDSLVKINNNFTNLDNTLCSALDRIPDRELSSNRNIFIDSTLGNDSTADGTIGSPFKTIAAAVTFYLKNVWPKGVSPIFQLQPGTPTNPKVYKGAHIQIYPSYSIGRALRQDDAPTNTDPYTYYNADSTFYIQGYNTTDPSTVIIDSFFTVSRTGGTGIVFYNAAGLKITAPKCDLVISNVTFRYNAVGNLPEYAGTDQLYNLRTDEASHLIVSDARVVVVKNCILRQMVDPNTYDVDDPRTDTSSYKYMLGIGFYNCQYARLDDSITVSGTMRYIAKTSRSELNFYNCEIILQNSPRFLALFEIEYGGTLSISRASTTEWTLSFTGSCGTPITTTTGTKNWFNYIFVNYYSAQFGGYGHGFIPQGIDCPSQTSAYPLVWPNNTTSVELVHRGLWYSTPSGINYPLGSASIWERTYYYYFDNGTYASEPGVNTTRIIGN